MYTSTVGFLCYLPKMNTLDPLDIFFLDPDKRWEFQIYEEKFLFELMNTYLKYQKITPLTQTRFELERIPYIKDRRRVLYLDRLIGYLDILFNVKKPELLLSFTRLL